MTETRQLTLWFLCPIPVTSRGTRLGTPRLRPPRCRQTTRAPTGFLSRPPDAVMTDRIADHVFSVGGPVQTRQLSSRHKVTRFLRSVRFRTLLPARPGALLHRSPLNGR